MRTQKKLPELAKKIDVVLSGILTVSVWLTLIVATIIVAVLYTATHK